MPGMEVQTEAEELASVMAGYNQARGEQPPADEVPEPSVVQEEVADKPAAESLEAETPTVDPAVVEQPSITSLAEELKTLKAKVASSASDPEVVRRMYGEIGNINRTLKQLQTSETPDSDLSAALKEAEKVAEDYPEMAGPLVAALKASLKNQTKAEPVDIDARVDHIVEQRLRAKDIQTLEEAHPDRLEVYKSEEFRTWLAAKPVAFQEKVNTTWSPIVASKALDEYKASLKAQEKKQERLAAAVAPQGTSQRAKPSVLPDDEGLFIGYKSGPKRQIIMR